MTDRTETKRVICRVTVRETKGGVRRRGDPVWRRVMTEAEYELWFASGQPLDEFEKTTAE